MDHSHDHTDEIARSALKQIAKTMGLKYSEIVSLFIQGHVPTTHAFWLVLQTQNTGQYTGVDYCPDCKKFTLYPKK